jgi:hypothetical protein
LEQEYDNFLEKLEDEEELKEENNPNEHYEQRDEGGKDVI